MIFEIVLYRTLHNEIGRKSEKDVECVFLGIRAMYADVIDDRYYHLI